MSEERTLVLEMLATGKIDVAQADELLDGLEPSTASMYVPPSPEAQPLSRLSPKQLIELKNHDIDAHFLRSVQGLGLSSLSFDEILELGMYEIPAEFIRELRSLFPDIDVKQIIELYNHDIDTDFLRELREANLLSHDPETIIELKEERNLGENA